MEGRGNAGEITSRGKKLRVFARTERELLKFKLVIRISKCLYSRRQLKKWRSACLYNNEIFKELNNAAADNGIFDDEERHSLFLCRVKGDQNHASLTLAAIILHLNLTFRSISLSGRTWEERGIFFLRSLPPPATLHLLLPALARPRCIKERGERRRRVSLCERRRVGGRK